MITPKVLMFKFKYNLILMRWNILNLSNPNVIPMISSINYSSRVNNSRIRVRLGLRFQKVRFKITILKCAI
jgi:hypothetical protein